MEMTAVSDLLQRKSQGTRCVWHGDTLYSWTIILSGMLDSDEVQHLRKAVAIPCHYSWESLDRGCRKRGWFNELFPCKAGERVDDGTRFVDHVPYQFCLVGSDDGKPGFAAAEYRSLCAANLTGE